MSTIDFSIRRRDLAWMIAMVLVVSSVWVARSDPAAGGSDPIVGGIDLVYVTVGTNYPDALGVGPGAALNGAPIILVPTHPPIDTATSAELVRLYPKKVVIIGGTSAVSDATQDALEELLPAATFERIAGSNRYKTNALFTSSVYPVYEWISLSASAFRADVSVYSVSLLAGVEIYNSTSGILYAAVDLPHGGTIMGLEMSGVDTVEGLPMTARLMRALKEDCCAPVQIVGISSYDAAGSFHVAVGEGGVSGSLADVDNENYTYLVRIEGATGATALRGIHIKVRLGAPGV